MVPIRRNDPSHGGREKYSTGSERGKQLMRYVVDAALCCGHGQCYGASPEVYEANDEGENAAIGKSVDVAPGHEAAARRGATRCPESAIKIFD